jgi:hypothetical protein
MANAVYPKFRESLLKGTANLITGSDVLAVLVDTNGGTPYTYSAAHEFLSDIPSGARVFTSTALANKTGTLGVFDADDITMTAVTGISAEAIVLFLDTGTAATSSLICYLDTGVSGLPVTPSGGNISIIFDSGPNKIFAIG